MPICHLCILLYVLRRKLWKVSVTFVIFWWRIWLNTNRTFILADNIFCPCQSEENMNLNVHCKCLAVSDLSQTLMKTLESSNQEHWTRSFTECVLHSDNNQYNHRKQDLFFKRSLRPILMLFFFFLCYLFSSTNCWDLCFDQKNLPWIYIYIYI